MASAITPEGSLRKAMRWLSERRQEDPAAPRQRLIEEAGVKFDLSPVEVEFLYANWK
jgi:hypothetical protein